MGLLTLIGDVHGKTGQYCHKLPQFERSIQLGDMGLGFKGVGLPPPGTVPPDFTKHRFIRGNHDNPAKCQRHPGYLGEFGFLPEDNIFYIGGAFSIDREWRTEGIDWWADEQLSYQQLDDAIKLYLDAKPRFVVSHECPQKTSQWILLDLIGQYAVAKGACINTRTCQAMQNMLEGHQPEAWIFGHYHIDKFLKVPGFNTQFVCRAELSTITLNTETGELI